MRYIKQIDAMRAIAIIFVFFNHSTDRESLLYKASLIVSAPDVFFTISGFLITVILFKDKNAYIQQRTTKSAIFKSFFIKRILRIFPAYYLTILVTYLINPNGIKSLKPYLLFTANFDIYDQQDWSQLSHLWSMSVEQQFYLIWPFAIVFTPRKLLPFTIGLFITIGIFSQRLILDTEFTTILPQTCFDALGLGALLAWLVTYKPESFDKAHRIFSIVAATSVFIIFMKDVAGFSLLPFISHRTFIALIVVWLISYFIHNQEVEGGRLGFIFNNKYLITIGKFSYGFYLFHLTCLYYSYDVLHSFNEVLPFYRFIAGSRKFYIAENLLLVSGLAWLSWKYFELPIYALQKRLITATQKQNQPSLKLSASVKAEPADAHQLVAAE